MSINDDFFNEIVQTTADNECNYNPAKREKEKADHAFLRAEAKKIAIKELVDTITPVAMERIRNEAKLGEVDTIAYTISLAKNYDHMGNTNDKRYLKVDMGGKLMTFKYSDLLFDETFKKSFGKFKVVPLMKCKEKVYDIKFIWGESRRNRYN